MLSVVYDQVTSMNDLLRHPKSSLKRSGNSSQRLWQCRCRAEYGLLKVLGSDVLYASLSKSIIYRDSQYLDSVSSEQVQLKDHGDYVRNRALFTSHWILGLAHKISQQEKVVLAGRLVAKSNVIQLRFSLFSDQQRNKTPRCYSVQFYRELSVLDCDWLN